MLKEFRNSVCGLGDKKKLSTEIATYNMVAYGKVIAIKVRAGYEDQGLVN